MTSETDLRAAQIEVFWKIHEGLPKQGPGSDASTRRALECARPFPTSPKILDLGCGPGRQSLVLARETGGTVSAVDLLPPFLAQLDERAASEGLGDRITTRQASMGELDDPDGAYDLIWSEGAIYNIGFSAGLAKWRRLLGEGQCVAVSEVSWLVPSPDEAMLAYWTKHYPGIRDRATNERLVERAGYRLRESFVLPEQEWWDDYYSLIEERVEKWRHERDDEAWRVAIAGFDEEFRIIREGLGSFGYVFFVMEKASGADERRGL